MTTFPVLTPIVGGVAPPTAGEGVGVWTSFLTDTWRTQYATYFAPYGDVLRAGDGSISTTFNIQAFAENPAILTPDVQYWLDRDAGLDTNDGLSSGSPKKTALSVKTAGEAAAGTSYRVNVVAGKTFRRNESISWANAAASPAKHTAWIVIGGGRSVMSQHDDLTWSLDTGTTYKATRSNAYRAFDIATLIADSASGTSDYTELTFASSLANCRATPGTWWTDNVTVYVNRADAAAVTNANSRLQLNQSGARCANGKNVYFEGIDFEGGNLGSLFMIGNATGRVAAKNCSFKYACAALPGVSPVNLVVGLDIGAAAFENCVASRGNQDAFNFHQNAGFNPFLITVNCHGHHCGQTGTTSDNGWTIHDGICGIDINGNYHDNAGGNVAIVGGALGAGTAAAMLGIQASNSLGDIALGGVLDPTDFQSGQASGSSYEARLYVEHAIASVSTYSAQGLNGGIVFRRGSTFGGLSNGDVRNV